MIVWNGRFLGSSRLQMGRVECEQAAAILKHEPQPGRHVVRAEPVEVALDQAHAVKVTVDDRHVNRVGLRRVARHRVQVGLLAVRSRPPARGIWLGDQRRDRQRAKCRIGVIFGPVFIGELLGLDHQMKRLGRLRAQAFEVIRLEQVEHLQGGDALTIGRQLPDVVAAIIGRNGFDKRARMLGEIRLREKPADRARVPNDRVGERPLVKGVPAAARDRFEAIGQGRDSGKQSPAAGQFRPEGNSSPSSESS